MFNIDDYYQPYKRFLEQTGLVPNSFLIAPDQYAALQEEARDSTILRAAADGRVPKADVEIILYGCPVYVVPSLPPGAIRAAWIKHP